MPGLLFVIKNTLQPDPSHRTVTLREALELICKDKTRQFTQEKITNFIN